MDSEYGLPLTVTEVRTLEYIAEGLTYKQIATRECIVPHTVGNRVGTIMRKLGARNATHAAVLGAVLGWLDVPRAAILLRPVPDWTKNRPREEYPPRRRRKTRQG